VAGNWRVAIAFAFIGAMVVALVLLLLPDEDDPVAATTSRPSTTTTSSPTTTTSTTTAETTTTSVQPGDRLAEVERILEELEIARLVAIYNRDESALNDVVAIQAGIDAAIDAMDTLKFVEDPSVAAIRVTVLEVLLDRPDCLVVFHEFDGRATLGGTGLEQAVRVLWPREDGSTNYRLARLWSSPGDLWQDDCDLMDRGEVP